MIKDNIKERDRNERRILILGAAKEIVSKEGIDGISIRKISNKIGYSPAIIYHYFQNKEEIINSLMQEGYGEILKALSSVNYSELNPVQRISKGLQNYINISLENPEYYKYVMLSDSKEILEHTSVLFRGSSYKRQAIAMLCTWLEEVNGKSEDTELNAQIIWASTYGLIIRLIIEKDLAELQKNNLINHHTAMIIKLIQAF